MNTIILKLLRSDAKKWWNNVQLRKWGNHAEATKKERKQIRDAVATLRRIDRPKIYLRGRCVDCMDTARFMLSGVHRGEWHAILLRERAKRRKK
jgi:hypothetical protein